MTRIGIFSAMLRQCGIGLLLAICPLAYAAYSCTVTATDASVLANALSAETTTGSVTLTCTRSAGDAPTLSYRLKATTGLYNTGSQPYRRVRRGGAGTPMEYSLRRGSTCGATSDWLAPATGTTDVQTGTMNFGTALVASTTLAYCIRVPATSVSSGVYTDTFLVFAQYPDSDMGNLSPQAPATVTVGVGDECLFNTYPGNLVFNYTAFSTTAQTASTGFVLRCNSGLPWEAFRSGSRLLS